MNSSDRFDWAVKHNEPQTEAALQRCGYTVTPYGQGLLTEATRDMLKHVDTPQRWTPDFLVARPGVVDIPHWPKPIRPKYTFLVDAKYRWSHQKNYSIEMRSLVAASTFGMDTYYAFSTRDGETCDQFVVGAHHVLASRGFAAVRPCCGICAAILVGPNPMRNLPQVCPNQQRGKTASSTPYVVVEPTKTVPLTDYAFDNLRPYWDEVTSVFYKKALPHHPVPKRSPTDWCPGCGYYWFTHGETHRADCTATQKALPHHPKVVG